MPIKPGASAPITDVLLLYYPHSFFGYGRWQAPIWFVGIEESAGWTEIELGLRLKVWAERGRRELEDAPVYFPEAGITRWHGAQAELNPYWQQFIRMLFLARGKSDSPEAILEYQRTRLGTAAGETCLVAMYPLCSPSLKIWNYAEWSNLWFLKNRRTYQHSHFLQRAARIQQMLRHHNPKVIIFYSSTWHKLWSLIVPGPWTQVIKDEAGDLMLKLSGFNGLCFIIRHPANENDEYFSRVANFFRANHASSFGNSSPGR